ncbi:hypothetical protein CERZMDRAFT_99793 [Cercospora zeae-maydis SCOH1-5]|uniref:Uncharacterized protein n=1 Tax=Cercospora zeae-maydis SCOH1-5 TaxID=717836 RepID=A0A6A6F9M7_9PEZI|nr:hypothetical protein CERZMDRAFT_99793 [Cercospora zeae-maydis SCOH1-5]
MAGMNAIILTPPTNEHSQNSESWGAEPSLSGLRLSDSNTRPSTNTPTHKPRGRRFIATMQHNKNIEDQFDLTDYPLPQDRTYEGMPPPHPNQRPSFQRISQPSILPAASTSASRGQPTTYPNANPHLLLVDLHNINHPSRNDNQIHALLTNLTTTKLIRSIHARLLLTPDTFGAQLLAPLQTLFPPHTNLALNALNSFPLPLGEKLRALTDNQKRLESQICLGKVLAFLEMLRILPAASAEMTFVVAKTEKEVQEILTRMCEHDAQQRSQGDFMAVQEYLRREMEVEEAEKKNGMKKEMQGEAGMEMVMEELLKGDGGSLDVNVEEDLAL